MVGGGALIGLGEFANSFYPDEVSVQTQKGWHDLSYLYTWKNETCNCKKCCISLNKDQDKITFWGECVEKYFYEKEGWYNELQDF